MHVGVLGPLLVSVDGRDLTPAGQRLRDVLTVLLQRRGRPVPVPVILDLVWGDRAAGVSGAVVHTVVARLRRLLGAAAISTHQVGYLVDRATSTDEDSFAAAARDGSRLRDNGEWAAAAGAFRGALDHWRGGAAFEGVSDDLVEADRARLAELRAAVVQDLVAVLIDHPEAGERGEAARLAAGLMAQLPLQERPYQLAMLAAYREHRQADALSIYQRLRATLGDDLGIAPSPSSTRLRDAILSQEDSLQAPAPGRGSPVGPTTGTAGPAGTVGPPVSAGPLLGREEEIGALLSALDGGRKVVTVVGPGGVGKTRLMAELAARLPDRRSMWVGLAGSTRVDADELAEAVAVGQRIPASRQTAAESLAAVLSVGRWLVLIDEAEGAAAGVADLITAVLGRTTHVQFVVTSRRPLDVSGEHLVVVEPFACPSPGASPEGILAAPAVRFLIERLADHGVRVDDDPAAAHDLAAIAQGVDGLPLALDILAGQAGTRSLSEVAALVVAPLDVASAQPRSGRHRSLRAALASTTDGLDPVHSHVLGRLAVFAGSFDLAAAIAVAAEPEASRRVAAAPRKDGEPDDGMAVADIVRALVREALIHVDRSDPAGARFRLLHPVRELVREWSDPVELATTRRRHRRWYADRWRGHPRLDDVIDNVRGCYEDFTLALQTALVDRDSLAAADLCLTLGDVWRLTGARGAGLRWTTRVLDADLLPTVERAAVQTHRAALALRHRGELALADTAAAIPVLRAAMMHSAAQESLAASHLVSAHLVRAIELLALGRHTEAIEQVDLAVLVARRSPGRLATALSVQAYVQAAAGDPEIALAAVIEVESCWTAMGSTAERVVVCGNLAYALLTLDRPREALDLLDGLAPAIPRALGATPEFYLLDTGWAALGCGELHRSLECFRALLTSESPIPADRQSVETFIGTSCVLARLGQPSAARTLQGALGLADAIGMTIAPPLRRHVDRAMAELHADIVHRHPVSGPVDLLVASLAADLRLAVVAAGAGDRDAPRPNL